MDKQRQSAHGCRSQRSTHRRSLVLGVSLLIGLSQTGFAQSVSNPVPLSRTSFTKSDCGKTDSLTYKFVASIPVTTGQTPTVFMQASVLVSNACPSAASASTSVSSWMLAGTAAASDGTQDVTFQTDAPAITISSLLSTTTDVCTTPGNGTRGLCFYYSTDGTLANSQLIAGTSFFYTYNTNVVDLTVGDVTAGDKQIKVGLTTSSTASQYELCSTSYTDPGDEGAATALVDASDDCAGLTLTSFDGAYSYLVWTGLVNDTHYVFKIRTVDFSGNRSDWSNVLKAQPQAAHSALEIFDGAPNPASFGCDQNSSQSPELAWYWVLLVGLWIWRTVRIKPAQSGLGLALVVMLMAGSSHAGVGQLSGGIIGAGYRPNLDANSTYPFYTCMFGQGGKNPWVALIGLEGGVHIWENFGSLQLGMAGAYTFAGGYGARSLPTSADCVAPNTSVDVGLHILQLRPQLSYMLDEYVDLIPIVPYVRVGLVGSGYVFTYQGEVDKLGQDRDPAQNPVGMMFGYELAAGIMFALDGFEPDVTAVARGTSIYEHIYLKAEMAYMKIDNFGAKSLDFSPKGPFEWDQPVLMTFGLMFDF